MGKMTVYCHRANTTAVLRATGPDAFTFLQSQFSNDLNWPEVEKPVTYGLWLDHKGKIQADSFVIQQTKEIFLLVSYDCPVAALRAHLEAHLIADEVELHDETAASALAHVWADGDFEALQTLVEKLGEAAGAECWLGRRPNGAAWDVLAEPAALDALVETLREHGGQAVGVEELHAERLVSGIPAVPLDAGPGDLPQEAGLGADAVSYDKGCYLGQEVMMRLHTQGHANRALWQVGWETGAPDLAGGQPVPLFAGADQVGELRSRVIKGERGLALAMLKNRAVQGKTAFSFTPSGPVIVNLVRGLGVT